MNRTVDLGLEPPRYQRLAASIAQRIGRGAYRVGTLIPPEEQLCREFGFSRFTVRAALRHLQETGLVTRRQGVGTEVLAATPSRVFAHTIGSIDELQQYAKDTRLTGHRTALVEADDALAGALECRPGDRLLRIDAIRVRAGAPRSAPVAWTRIHLIDAYSGIRDELKTLTGAIGTRIEERYGERITAIEQTVRAVGLEGEAASRLRVPSGTAGLRIDRRYLGRDGRPFECVTALHPGYRFSLSMRLDRAR